MRILVISREIPPVGGGAGSVALELSSKVASAGHDVHILTMHHGNLPSQETRGRLTIQRIPCGRRHQDSAGLGSMGRFVVGAAAVGHRLARKKRFDFVHAHAIVPDGIVARSIGQRHGIPFVVTAHGTDVPGYDYRRFRVMHRMVAPTWQRVVGTAAHLTAPSHYLRDLILRTAPSAQVTVLPNGIDLSLFDARKPKRSAFLIVSRLVTRKNYVSFFEALAAVEGELEIHVVGEGPELPRLRSLAASTQHNVTFHGWLAHGSEPWRRLYEECRFFVFPSMGENFPINLLEAQLAGMTVLASRIPGNREVLGDEAIFFSSTAPDAIARTVRECVQRDPAELDALGQRAVERVRSHFSWDTVATEFLRGLGKRLGTDTHA